jgi:GH25 family lysozyme M1 (1,4-beta-N-acetylmuramidase)
MSAPVCIDISHWQDFPDFDEVAQAGVLGVIHKATEGTGYVDPNRAANLSNAKRAGLAIATYHWIKPGNAKAQMNFYLDTIEPERGERVVIDYEEDGCSLDDLHEAVQTLLDAKLDLKITVYSGHLLKEQLGDDTDDFLAENTDLWLAQYTSNEDDISWPDGTYDEWTLWQYSESGSLPGIYGSAVDMNNFNGSDEEFLLWISPGEDGPPEPPTPPDQGDTVFVSVFAPEGVQVKIKVLNKLPAGDARRGPDLKKP